jgi:hypothetical protein
LYYSDDNAFLDDIFDEDYTKKHFLSIPDEPACDRNRNRIMGGPQPPGPNATEEEMKSYELKRKAFTDASRRKIMAAFSSVNKNVSPQKHVLTVLQKNAAKTPSPQRQQSKRYTKTPNRS